MHEFSRPTIWLRY